MRIMYYIIRNENEYIFQSFAQMLFSIQFCVFEKVKIIFILRAKHTACLILVRSAILLLLFWNEFIYYAACG